MVEQTRKQFLFSKKGNEEREFSKEKLFLLELSEFRFSHFERTAWVLGLCLWFVLALFTAPSKAYALGAAFTLLIWCDSLYLVMKTKSELSKYQEQFASNSLCSESIKKLHLAVGDKCKLLMLSSVVLLSFSLSSLGEGLNGFILVSAVGYFYFGRLLSNVAKTSAFIGEADGIGVKVRY